jgi:hypothetical protein
MSAADGERARDSRVRARLAAGMERGPTTPATNACSNACVTRPNCPRNRRVGKLHTSRLNPDGDGRPAFLGSANREGTARD